MRGRGAPEGAFSKHLVSIGRSPSEIGGRKLCVYVGLRRPRAPDFDIPESECSQLEVVS